MNAQLIHVGDVVKVRTYRLDEQKKHHPIEKIGKVWKVTPLIVEVEIEGMIKQYNPVQIRAIVEAAESVK